MTTYEANFDGLVGNTHNYAGLAIGDMASMHHAFMPSNPRAAALQGLNKMKLLVDLGLQQAIIPPQPRPAVSFLKSIGITGNSVEDILKKAYQTHPRLFAACYSASGMWAANAATISPSFDAVDKRVHITPANLSANLHRMLEAEFTTLVLRRILADPELFEVHEPLSSSYTFSDEGAANHSRFCTDYDKKGVELFVYGKSLFDADLPAPQRFPARQTLEASQSIARLHKLDPSRVIFAQQNPAVIDQGVFHNDVIAVGNQRVLLYHEQAYLDTENVITKLQHAMDHQLIAIKVTENELSIKDAVASYLFNSQLVSLPNKDMVIIAPQECAILPSAHHVLERILAEDNPIKSIYFIDCHQSMQNGGGPACLRLRMVLNEKQRHHMHQGIFLTETLYHQLVAWIEKHYRDHLTWQDLFSPDLFFESQRALSELEGILDMPGLYAEFLG